MKRIIFILLIILAVPAISEEGFGWKRLLDELTYEIVVDPLDYNTIYAGSTKNIVYKSIDGGKTWDTIHIVPNASDSKMNNMISTRKDHNVLMVGGLGLGNLYRTADRGKTWTSVAESVTRSCYLNGKALAEHPNIDGNILMAGYYDNAIFESKDNGITWDTLSMVYSPKLDTSGKFIPGTKHKQFPTCLAIRQDSANILMCGNQGGLVMMSKDYGKTWTDFKLLRERLNPDEIDNFNSPNGVGDCEITMIAHNNTDPLKLYASITYNFFGNLPNGGIWRSLDGGNSWNLFAFPDSSFWGVASRTLKDGNEEVFVGGYSADPSTIDSLGVPGAMIVRGTFDGGKTWWVFDNTISWIDPAPVYKSIKMHRKTLITVGTQASIAKGSNRTGLDLGIYTYSNSKATLNDAIVLKKDSFLICGNNGTLHENKEVEFSEIKTGFSENLNSLAQVDDYLFYCVGDNGLVLKSHNNIRSWVKEEGINTNSNLHKVKYLSDKLYVCGDNGTILIKDLKKNTWTEKKITDEAILSLDITSKGLAAASGSNGTLFISKDFGETWTKKDLGYADTLFGVACNKDNQVICVGKKSLMMYSKDAGESWETLKYPKHQDLYSVTFTQDNLAMCCGTSRTVFKAILDSGYANTITSDYGPIGNVWSLRYFGPKYEEKLYMATEAGLFVFEGLKSTVENIGGNSLNDNLNLKLKDNELYIAYRRHYENERNLLKMRLINLSGHVVFSKEYTNYLFENIIDQIDMSSFPNGAYIIEYLEKDKKTTKKFIKY